MVHNFFALKMIPNIKYYWYFVRSLCYSSRVIGCEYFWVCLCTSWSFFRKRRKKQNKWWAWKKNFSNSCATSSSLRRRGERSIISGFAIYSISCTFFSYIRRGYVFMKNFKKFSKNVLFFPILKYRKLFQNSDNIFENVLNLHAGYWTCHNCFLVMMYS